MKKTLLGLTFASLFMAGAVQAEDHSATIDISGNVTADQMECTVYTDSSTVNLSGKIADLPSQGGNATNDAALINYSVGSNDSAQSCYGKVALQFHGIPDQADGTVLENSDTSATAAKGVGIGIYDSNLNPLFVNVKTLEPQANGQIYLQMVKLNGQTPVEGSVHGSLTIDIVRL